MPIGIPELLVILVIVLLIFGPKRLPMLGRQLGGGMREFKDSLTGKGGSEDDDEDDEAAQTPAAAALPAAPVPVAPPTGETDAFGHPVVRRDEPAAPGGRDAG
jgi:sec-independent protein translocase protein TatA